MVVTGQNRSTRNVPVLLDWNRSRSSAVTGRHGPRYGPDVRNPIQSLLPVILHQESPVSYTVISRSVFNRNKQGGLSNCPLVWVAWPLLLSSSLLEGLLIGEQWWMSFNLCRKTKISCSSFAVLCSKLINHFQTYQSTSTHTHHLTHDPKVHCSADTARTVVGGFLNRSFENFGVSVGNVWA